MCSLTDATGDWGVFAWGQGRNAISGTCNFSTATCGGAACNSNGLKARECVAPPREPTRCSYVQVMLMAEHVSHLHSTASRAVRLHAVQELRKHSREVTNRATMGSLPSAMQQLVALLQDGDEQLREHAAGTLCNLCCSCEANKAKFGQEPGAITALCELLASAAASPATKAAAAAAVSNLAHDHADNQALLGRMPGVLPALLRLLQEQQPARLRIAAARALECLAPHNQDSLASQPGALTLLTQCLAAAEAAVRSSAAATLQRLVWLHAANAAELALHTAGAVAGLAALLRDKESAKAREHAAAALGNLCCRDEGIKAAVGSQAGVLTGLVQQLGDRHAPVRAAAAAALKSLAAHCVENQTRIGAIVGALKGLQVLLHDADLRVRREALDCLRCLAAAHTCNWFMLRKELAAAATDMHTVTYILSQ
uniref:Vacuolar protein 8 n=1 Tax=Tetradesmus obliquus TaxID=3088 RepID=A0A383VBP4_TETOB|eukprot:jgi/Sobl393_1/12971/SZX62978.1